MRKKNFKGKIIKFSASKCKSVCKTYDPIQYAYVQLLEQNDEIVEIRCNEPLEGTEVGEYMTDFVCVKKNGDLMVRECVYQKLLTKPLTIKLLDGSKRFWGTRGVTDWGVVIDEQIDEE